MDEQVVKKQNIKKHVFMPRFFILGALGAMSFLFFGNLNFVSAKNFNIFNATNANQSYFSVNGTTGNVGVGTINPTAPLTIQQTNDSSGFKLIGNSDPTTIFSFYIGAGGSNNPRFTSTKSMVFEASNGVYFRGPSGVFINDSNSANILLASGGGNVGIGTSTPNAKLQVMGSVNATGLCLSGDCKTEWSQIVSAGGVGTGTSGQTLRNNGSTWIADSNIYNNGTYVGIGTTVPGTNKLSVIGNIAGVGDLKISSSTNSFVSSKLGVGHLTSGSSMLAINGNASIGDAYYNSAAPADGLIVEGNVGIGTTAPNRNIQINNSIGFAPSSSGNASGILGITGSDTAVTMNFGIAGSAAGFPSGLSWIQAQNNTSAGTTYPLALNPNGGNVGIGTTAPGQKLDVSGSIRTSSQLISTVANGTAPLVVTSQTKVTNLNADLLDGHDTSYFQTAITNPVTGTGSSGYLPKFTGTSAIGNSNVYTNGTSIGIGTTGPTGKLHIDNGTVIIDKDYGIRGDSYNSGARNYIWGLSNAYPDRGISYYEGASDYLSFHPGGLTSVLAVTDAGRVGIGTTAPMSGTALHVIGTTLTTGLAFSGNPSDVKFSWSDIVTAGGGNQWITSGTNIYNANYNTGNVGIGTTGPGSKLDVRGGVNITGVSGFSEGIRLHAVGGISSLWFNAINGSGFDAGMFGITTDATGMRFRYGTGASPSDLVNILNNGNVGIGDTAPSDKLTIVGGLYATNGLKIGSSTAANWIYGRLGVGHGTAGASKFAVNGNASIGDAYFSSAAPADGLIVEGNVGIGTTNPTAALAINKGYSGVATTTLKLINANTPGAIAGPGISFTGYYEQALITSYENASSYVGGNLQLQTYNHSGVLNTGLVLNYAGNVGIGTTAPGQKLDVVGSIRTSSQLISTMANGTAPLAVTSQTKVTNLNADLLDGHDTSYFQTAITNPVTGSGSSGYLPKFTSTSAIGNSNVYTNGTNVGVGTSNPGAKLDVQSSGYGWPATSGTAQTYGGLRVSPPSSSGSVVLDTGANSSSGAWLQVTNRTDLSTEYPLILNPNGGSVGIGTISPDPAARLDVNGSIKTTGLCFGSDCRVSWDAVGSFWSGTSGGNIWNTNSGKVGIGTTNPTAKLEVSGNIKTTQVNGVYFSQGASSYDQGMRVSSYSGYSLVGLNTTGATGSDANSFWMIYNDADASTNFGFNGYQKGTTAFNINKSNIVSFTNNVGIGTTAPSEKLSVIGDISGTGSLEISNSALNSWIMSTTTTIGLNSAAASKLAVWGNQSIGQGYISSAAPANGLIVQGNVGIGTTNPASAKLVTVGGTYGVAISDRNYTISTGALPGLHVVASNNYAGDGGTILLGGSSGPTAYIRSFATSNNAGELIIGNRRNSNDDTMLAGIVLNIAGNVGIGTTAPGQKLDVAGSIRTSSQLISTMANGTAPLVVTSQTKVTNLNADLLDGHDTSYFQTAITNPVTGSGSSGYLPKFTGASAIGNSNVYTNGTNVGIGTTAPAGKMEIKQNMTDYSTSFTGAHLKLGASNIVDNTGFVGITFDSSTSANYGWSIGALRGTNGASDFVWKNHQSSVVGTEVFRIVSGGNVGIGTTTPNAKLQVMGSVNATGLCLSGDCKSAWSQIVTAGGGLNFTGTNGQTIRNNNGTWAADSNIYNNGSYVGIGTNNPREKTDIAGALRVGSDGKLTAYSVSGGSCPSCGTETVSLQTTIDDRTVSAGLPFAEESRHVLALQPSFGRVGIGDTAPSDKLTIVGGLYATNGLKIGSSTAANWIYGSLGVGHGTAGTSKFAVNGNASIGDAYYNSAAPADGLIVEGNVGIGTANPAANLHVISPSVATPALYLQGQGPTIKQQVERTGGGYAFSMFDLYALNQTTALSTHIGQIGAYGDMQSGVTPPSVNYLYMGAEPTVSHTNNTLRLYPNKTAYFNGNVGIGTTNPGSYRLNVAGNTYLNGTLTATGAAAFNGGATITGNLAMAGTRNITNVNKITANVVDPLYNIKGTNYSTFASSIAGGLKEEYVGRVSASDFLKKDGYYETTIDLTKEKEGSDLWVWYHVVEFNDENVEVFLTPRNGFASTYSLISGSNIIIRSDRPADLSMRLVGSRFDWRKWPTKPLDQTEKASLIIE